MIARASIAVALAAAGCAYDRPALAGDAAIDAPPDAVLGDADGDGHLDGADNCRDVANAHQDDADRDGIGDVCDGCPATADVGAAANLDGDGLGDSCDPQIGTRQCIAWFDGFGDERTRPRYQTRGGTWKIADGTLQQRDVNAATDLGISGLTFVSPRVITSAAITELSAGLTTYQIGVTVDVSTFGTDDAEALFGDLIRRSGQLVNNLVMSELRPGGTLVSTSGTTPVVLAVGTSLTLAADTRAPGAAIASVSDDDQPGALTEVQLTGTHRSAGGAGLRTRGAAAQFDYLLVVVDADDACPPRGEP